MTEIEIYVAMNENGDYEAATESEDATTRLIENAGGDMVRLIKIIVKMDPPVMAEVDVEVPAEAGTTEKIEAEVA
jgi:hypothetical protein